MTSLLSCYLVMKDIALTCHQLMFLNFRSTIMKVWVDMPLFSDLVLHYEVLYHFKPLSPSSWQYLSLKQSQQWKFYHGEVISF